MILNPTRPAHGPTRRAMSQTSEATNHVVRTSLAANGADDATTEVTTPQPRNPKITLSSTASRPIPEKIARPRPAANTSPTTIRCPG